nr:MAG TPA: Helix-turn-helix XRE-family like protein [Caudoviricetes sp.]
MTWLLRHPSFLFILKYTVVFYTVVLYDEYRKRGDSMRSKEDIAKLVAMMKENNWTQVKLAERLHVSQQVISRTITEKGTIKMSPIKVEMMYKLIAKPYPASDIQI